MLGNLSRALGRVFPNCITLGQAIAFNMFLAFFPLLLLAIGLLGETSLFRDALREIPRHLVMILPPGTSDVVSAYFIRPALHPWRWISLGTGGTILAGTQVMVGYMEGFRLIEGDLFRPTYLKRQLRALALVCLTICPMLMVVVLSVFGKSVRAWITLRIAMPPYVTHEVWVGLYISFTLLLALLTLVVLYRLGRPEHPNYITLLPGAAVATILWWIADVVFGWYVRVMPYTTVYRGLAAAIGLLLWMFFTALIVLLGAAYNAEYRESRAPRAVAGRLIAEDTPNAYGGASAKSGD